MTTETCYKCGRPFGDGDGYDPLCVRCVDRERAIEIAGSLLSRPAWAVARWVRQMSTPYHDLPIGENESDKAEADKMLAIFEKE